MSKNYTFSQVRYKMSKVTIYGLLASPPVRAVLIACELAGVPYELKVQEPGNKTPEFKKLNPQAQTPFLEDDGFGLPESRAILQYLMDKYSKDDSLYPKDLKARALVNARLNFDNGTLWPLLFPATKAIFSGNKVPEDVHQNIKNAFSVVEEFLTREKWIAGPKLTIADISYNVILHYMNELQFDLTPYPKILSWLEECNKVEALKKINEEGIASFRERLSKIGVKIQKP